MMCEMLQAKELGSPRAAPVETSGLLTCYPYATLLTLIPPKTSRLLSLLSHSPHPIFNRLHLHHLPPTMEFQPSSPFPDTPLSLPLLPPAPLALRLLACSPSSPTLLDQSSISYTCTTSHARWSSSRHLPYSTTPLIPMSPLVPPMQTSRLPSLLSHSPRPIFDLLHLHHLPRTMESQP
jgi:hypothetical protein